ncbi:MAG: TPM domain-containing protein [Bacteroidales bacterium]|nr:TPM domain-containing protein [Bacteroidales bacterium]
MSKRKKKSRRKGKAADEGMFSGCFDNVKGCLYQILIIGVLFTLGYFMGDDDDAPSTSYSEQVNSIQPTTESNDSSTYALSVSSSSHSDDEFIDRTLSYNGDLPNPPSPPRLVNDFAHVMTDDAVRYLEKFLVSVNDTTSNQVCVVTLNTLRDYDIAMYSQELFDYWGIGQADKNNGVLILVKVKTGNSNGQAFITTGYGLEGALPDISCSHIVNDKMIPYFKAGDYSSGIIAGAKSVVEAIQGEYTAEYDEDLTFGEWLALIGFLIIFPFLTGYFAIKDDYEWDHLSLAATLGLSIFVGYWEILLGVLSFAGSGGGGSSSGGGGFSGFGGGSSGGGGGGGSW